MPTQNVSLAKKQSDFIRRKVKSGDYHNASEVVRAGLRMLEQAESEQALKLEILKSKLAAGDADFDHGRFTMLEMNQIGNWVDGLSKVKKKRSSKAISK